MAEISLFEKMVRTYIGDKVKDRAPTEEELLGACAFIRGMIPVSDEESDLVVKKLQAALDVAMDVGVVIAKEYEPWLKARKDQIDFYYWDRYVLYLEEDLHRPSSIVSKIDEVSDKIVDLAGDPKAKSGLQRRGLIIGDVQSGKTANYIAVMNKAADVGFKVIILLTGTVESLRRQTQERVDEGFIGRSSKEYLRRNGKTVQKGVGRKDSSRFATGFTTEASDFKTSTVRSMNASLKNMSEPVVFVLKKNARTLLKFTFPHNNDLPAHFFEHTDISVVTVNISQDFWPPIIRICCRPDKTPAVVHMPETAVNKDDRLILGEYDIRTSGQSFYILSISETSRK